MEFHDIGVELKQEEKNQQSREIILQAAVEEFGKRGYEGASLNVLLADSGLSKGRLYHYFENKDQLYLSCVTLCFEKIADSLSVIGLDAGAKEILQEYFSVRGRFFVEHPQMERIFLDALVQPPLHLEAELKDARSGFERRNLLLFRAICSGLKLREGVSEEDALQFFDLMQRAIHLEFRSIVDQEKLEEVTCVYEKQVPKMLDLLLFGLAGREVL